MTLFILPTVTILVLSLSRLVSGQFGFFDQIFGHPGQHHQQQQRQGGPSQWIAQADAGACLSLLLKYLVFLIATMLSALFSISMS
jgi:hypothetical protein